MAAAQATQNAITLKGSIDIVTEFFGYAVNRCEGEKEANGMCFDSDGVSKRGIYPPEGFERVKKYGLTMLVTSDAALRDYLNNVMEQIKEWLSSGKLQRLVLVITDASSDEAIERWQFDIETENEIGPNGSMNKSEKEINNEIAAIIRQITASVTFLPLIEDACTFDLLVYTSADTEVPSAWEESDPRYVNNSSEVRLRSFTTKVHKVDTMVSYKAEATEEEQE